MPQQIIEYTLFIASPGDVIPERDIIRSVVDEYNLVNSHNNVKIVCLGWEKDIYPSIGHDPQDVINNQILDKYDIFVGLFWGRFGSPTKRDSSGTKEEFEIAYSRFLSDKTSISILMYFKNGSIDFENIDPIQILNINNFKKDLTEKGVLFKQFRETKEFEQMFRINLASLMQDLKLQQTSINNIHLTANPISKDDNELGIFEHLDNSVESFNSSAMVIHRLADYTNEIGTKINLRTEKLKSSNNLPFNEKQAYIRRNIDLVADDLNNFAEKIRIEIPLLNNEFSKALESCNKVIEISREYDLGQNTEFQEFYETLTNLSKSISLGKESIEKFNQTIFGMPSMTSKLIKSKKDSNNVLSNLISEMEFELNIIEEIRESIKQY